MHAELLYRRLECRLCFLALSIALNSPGDPREFFIQTVREHFPEFQVNYGFGLQTTGITDIHIKFIWKYKLLNIDNFNIAYA